MVTYREVFQKAMLKLDENKIENAHFDAKELFYKAFGKEPVYLDMSNFADAEKCSLFEQFIKRRANGEPLQYILGEWEFYSLPIKVGKGVLIPRQDTETLVDTAIELYKYKKDITAVDLCSGSGCIGIALEKNLDVKNVILAEKSHYAVKYIKENIKINNSKAKIEQGDVLSDDLIYRIPMSDLIVSNPPYLSSGDMKNLQKEVEFEPSAALFGGDDGLDFYRDIARLYKAKLKTGGHLMFEIGINQNNDVSNILLAEGFKNIGERKDLCGVIRVVFGEK